MIQLNQTEPSENISNKCYYFVEKLKSITKAKANFWGLGDFWWKAIIDPSYHHLGRYVFDENLHRVVQEKGYYESAKNAYQFVGKGLMAPLTVEFYKKIHKIACAHFDGFRTNTNLFANQVGTFSRPRSIDSNFLLKDLFASLPKTDQAKIFDELLNHQISYSLENSEPSYLNEWCTKEEIEIMHQENIERKKLAEQWLGNFKNELHDKIQKINSEIEQINRSLGGGAIPFAVLKLENEDAIYLPGQIPHLHIKYSCEYPEDLVKAAIDRFNEEIGVDSKKAKLLAIAKLFQTLEWLHCYCDGQGRTDLILLTKNLCRYGFTPAIIDPLFASSTLPLEEWVICLKNGMERWRASVA